MNVLIGLSFGVIAFMAGVRARPTRHIRHLKKWKLSLITLVGGTISVLWGFCMVAAFVYEDRMSVITPVGLACSLLPAIFGWNTSKILERYALNKERKESND